MANKKQTNPKYACVFGLPVEFCRLQHKIKSAIKRTKLRLLFCFACRVLTFPARNKSAILPRLLFLSAHSSVRLRVSGAVSKTFYATGVRSVHVNPSGAVLLVLYINTILRILSIIPRNFSPKRECDSTGVKTIHKKNDGKQFSLPELGN